MDVESVKLNFKCVECGLVKTEEIPKIMVKSGVPFVIFCERCNKYQDTEKIVGEE